MISPASLLRATTVPFGTYFFASGWRDEAAGQQEPGRCRRQDLPPSDPRPPLRWARRTSFRPPPSIRQLCYTAVRFPITGPRIHRLWRSPKKTVSVVLSCWSTLPSRPRDPSLAPCADAPARCVPYRGGHREHRSDAAAPARRRPISARRNHAHVHPPRGSGEGWGGRVPAGRRASCDVAFQSCHVRKITVRVQGP